ncbi:DUF1573 domain-containing protein [Sphingobacteriales bacterium CHB3]|nr:DUF1573 domain-containing protein [Sphingobacteriales bacterium CHB3]
MKRLLIVLACLSIATLSLYAQPKMEIVGGTKFDFGDVYRGKKVDHKVVVKNTGNQTLELGRVDVSCGCTGTVVSNNSIAPGKTGEVLITFNSTNFSGKVTKNVTINSNATNSPVVVEFQSNVIQEIVISPQQFWFRDAEVGRPSVAKISLTNNSNIPVTLTNYTCNLAGFKLTLPTSPVKPGQSVELTAELKSDKAISVLNDGVSIKTSSQNEPDVFVRIFGTVREFKFQ